MPPEPTPSNFTELAVAVGRIEEKVSRVAGLEERVLQVEKTVERIEASQRPRTPWYSVVGAVAAVIAGGGGLIAMFVTISQISAALAK